MSQETEAGFTTEIPMTFRRRGGKAVIVLPDGSRAIERREALIDNAMVKLLATSKRKREGTVAPASATCSNTARIASVVSSPKIQASVAELSSTKLTDDPHRARLSIRPSRTARACIARHGRGCAGWRPGLRLG